MIHGKAHVLSTSEVSSVDKAPLVIDIRISDVVICQQISTDDCKSLIHQMLKCQEIIFNDPGFSYQEYMENIEIHRQILVKYQMMCEDVKNGYLINDLFNLKKNQ